MTPLLASALALCLLGFPIASAGELNTCRFQTIDGVIKGHLSHSNTTARSLLDCSISSCGCNPRCVGSFNKKSGACVTATLSAAPLAWTKAFLFSNTSDKDWVSFAPVASFISLPIAVGLWLMDNSFRGRNLGSTGQRLDSSDTGLAWTTEGPLGSSSPLKYAYFGGSATPQIQVSHSGRFLLDYTVHSRTRFVYG